MKLIQRLHHYRFHIFFATQMIVLFISIILPEENISSLFRPLAFLLNLIAGLLIISNNRVLVTVVAVLMLIQFILSLTAGDTQPLLISRNLILSLLYLTLMVEIIKQIIHIRKVDSQIVFAMFSGYVTLGTIGFLILENFIMIDPLSMQFNMISGDVQSGDILYFSFITLLTIGYGDIIPLSEATQRTAILIGMSGQFYLTVVIALIIGKHLREEQ
ncbi:potassium channel family protein [Robertkochia aurantiaca]|uniref:potassium channel family protein n=1 Tax=Robertkochia aurantiaca TaxID=2873700 RepID=UPI001CC9A6C8|nr:potassium channel family protein [Robertkochia sp. 3YJGBD-33]